MSELNYLKLTDAIIRDAVMPDGKREHYLRDTDLPGLAVRMRATGGRTWLQFYSLPGVRGSQRKVIGPWPKFDEKAARKAAIGEVAKGQDPNQSRRKAKQEEAAAKARVTLRSLIEKKVVNGKEQSCPYELALTGRKVINWKVALSALRRGLAKHLDDEVGALTRLRITNAVDKVANTGRRGAADDLRKHAHTFFEWCVGKGYVEHNVLAGYRKPKQTRAEKVNTRKKGRALTDEEIIKVWAACGKLGTFGLLARLCLLGGPRRSEPTMLEWHKHVMDDRITFDESWTKMGQRLRRKHSDATRRS